MTKKGRISLTGTAAAALAALSISAIAFRWIESDGANDGVIAQAEITLGRRIYAERCASCHGVNLEGQPSWRERKPDGKLPAPPHDSSGHTWHHPDQVLIGITRNGLSAYAPAGYQSDMPHFAGILSDEEIKAVLAYIKSTRPEDIRNRQAAFTRSYRPEN
jgi:mono/diheme cytochrome c family protein